MPKQLMQHKSPPEAELKFNSNYQAWNKNKKQIEEIASSCFAGCSQSLASSMSDYKRILVTAALPYANGPVHIGHMAGVYVPADIYVRYQRARKRDIKFVSGSDEHGVPI